MKKIVATLTFAIAATSMLADAYARPMGGGRSIGRQSSNVTRQAASPAPVQAPSANPAARQAAPAPAPAPIPVQKPASPWKGMLGGALLGLGLGAMLSHFGLGGAVASMISSLLMLALLALIVYFIYRLFRGKSSAQANNGSYGFGGNQPLAQGAGGFTPEIGSRVQPSAFEPAASPAMAPGVSIDKAATVSAAVPAQWGVPADFDEPAFLRHAKTNFIRLQAAWDKADVNDIREFTTPEVYAELKMQIQERGANADFTDVVSIDAALLGIEIVETGPAPEYLASVKFSGLIRSAPGAAPEPLAEVWNMSKPVSGATGWVLAGIQQLS
jgi:predicted lipid-binding transport protein (Tim44 family)